MSHHYPVVDNLWNSGEQELAKEWACFCYDNGGPHGPPETPPMLYRISQKIVELEAESPHRDGFDDAYIQGWRDMYEMYENAMWSDGSPPEGLQYNHWDGLRDALNFVLKDQEGG